VLVAVCNTVICNILQHSNRVRREIFFLRNKKGHIIVLSVSLNATKKRGGPGGRERSGDVYSRQCLIFLYKKFKKMAAGNLYNSTNVCFFEHTNPL